MTAGSGDRPTARPLRLAVCISGAGRTLMNLADRIDDGTLAATIELVVSSRHAAAGVEKATARGLDVRVAARRDYSDDAAMHAQIHTWLAEANVDLICLAGYLRKIDLTPEMLGRVINIHPALLPRHGGQGMHGAHVHRAVLAAGDTVSGCTVHYVTEAYDQGPVILQRTCPVLPDDDADTLAARVFAEEVIAYPEAINMIARGEVRWADGRVVGTGAPCSEATDRR